MALDGMKVRRRFQSMEKVLAPYKSLANSACYLATMCNRISQSEII
jgi:hypothetical protein